MKKEIQIDLRQNNLSPEDKNNIMIEKLRESNIKVIL